MSTLQMWLIIGLGILGGGAYTYLIIEKSNVERALLEPRKECIDGVQYILFRNGTSVAHNRDGTIKICMETK